MEKLARLIPKLDRLLLALYLIALFGLLMLPISGAGRFMSMGGDNLIHDVIGVGTNNYFGPVQIARTAIGALIIV